MSFSPSPYIKTVYELYDKLKFDGYECLYGIHEDIGYSKDHVFPMEVLNFDWWINRTPSSTVLKDMNIAIMGDTHNYNITHIIKWLNNLPNCKYIIHTGDIGKPEMLDTLSLFNGKVFGILGNHDRKDAPLYIPYLKKYNNLDIKYEHNLDIFIEYSKDILGEFGVTHGDDFYKTEDIIDQHKGLDAIIMGHLHRPFFFYNKKKEQSIINPGICCKLDNVTLETENHPSFLLYNMKNPQRSVFMKLS